MLKQFKSTSLADQVFDRLENDIIQGVYPKGEILTELKLVEQLGVSRTPIRERVEGVAAYYATINMTPEGKKELTHLVDLQEFYFEKKDAERLRQVDDQFHDLICILSKRTVITDTLIPLHHKTRRYRRIAMEDWARATKTKGEHYEMYQAIVSGNAELAEELTTRHIMNAKKHMMEEMKLNG